MQGSLLMFTENLFHTELATQQERDIQTCSSHHQVSQGNLKYQGGQIFSSQDGAGAGMEAKDFTSYLIYINIYMMALIMSYFLFFNTEYRREKVNMANKVGSELWVGWWWCSSLVNWLSYVSFCSKTMSGR